MATILTVQDIVKKTTDLPTIPAAALQVMKLAESSTSSAADVAHTLANDQSLSVRVLRLANSAYYGLSRQISDLPEAVVVLGMRTVRNLAIVAATYPWLTKPLDGYALGPKQLWTHSFGTALGGQLIAKMSGKCSDDLAFTAGLLHDIGKVATSIWLENKLQIIMAFANREQLTFDEAERRLLGYDHTEVGFAMAEQWNLPASIVHAIRYHHDPDSCEPHDPVVDCVHIGNFLTMTMGFGLGADGLRYGFSEQALVRLGLSAENLDEVTDAFVCGYEKYEAMFEEMAGV